MKALCCVCNSMGPLTKSSGLSPLGVIHRRVDPPNRDQVVGLEIEGRYYCTECVRAACEKARAEKPGFCKGG